MEILSILMVAVTVEALTEWVKSLKKDGKVDTAMIVSLFIAELLTITAGLDLFAQVGLVFSVPYLGAIMTGIFLSRGSNYIFDFIEKLKNPKPE